jgi:hypothetical protein
LVHERRDLPGQRGPADHPARLPAADRPTRGSLADLRQRLDNLPPGHPSSPYDGDRTDPRPGDPKPGQERAPRDPPGDDRATGNHAPENRGAENRAAQDRGAENRAAQDRGAENRAAQDGAPQDRAAEDRGADGRGQGYWGEVPRFERLWAGHQERWPAAAAPPVDRSRDPEGSWRGDGNQYLSPEHHARAQDVIASVRAAEAAISAHMREAERDNGCGSRLAGWEYRRKGEDRLKEKIANLTETGAPNADVSEVMRDVPDAIRYTFSSDPAAYRDSYWSVKGLLEGLGYTMIYSKNHWRDDPDYKGINSRWTTPEGQRFELQFHTPESLHAKQEVTHPSYERIRNPLTGRSEHRELEAFQRDVCSWMVVPGGAASIPDYKELG